MPKGHVPKREGKKSKKKDDKKGVIQPLVLASTEVEATGKRRKGKREAEES